MPPTGRAVSVPALASRIKKTERFQFYWAIVLLRAATLVAVGLAILYWATTLAPGVDQTFLEGVGVALLTGAVVSVVMSGKLSRSLSNEILNAVQQESGKVLEAVGLSGTLRASGITEVVPRPPDWDALFRGAAEIVLLSTRPHQPDQDWAAALQVARTRPVAIDIYIPSGATPNMDCLADRLGEDKQALAANLAHLPEELVTQWQNVAPQSGGRLRIFSFDGIPGFAVARADRQCALLVPSIAGSRTGERPRTFVLAIDRDESWLPWLDDQLNSLSSDVLNQHVVP